MRRMTIVRAVAGASLILILAAPATARAAAWSSGGHAASAWDEGWRWLSSLWEDFFPLRHDGAERVAKDAAAGPAVASGDGTIVPADDSGPTINPDGHRH